MSEEASKRGTLPVLIEICARVRCGSEQAKRLGRTTWQPRSVSWSVEGGGETSPSDRGEAEITSRRRVEGNSPCQAVRKEATVLERDMQSVGIASADWLELRVSVERLVWDGERWRCQGEPVL